MYRKIAPTLPELTMYVTSQQQQKNLAHVRAVITPLCDPGKNAEVRVSFIGV